jgi:serine/threonine-protein kinase
LLGGARDSCDDAPVAEPRTIGGRYEIVRKIAEGGMGAVYEARHLLSKKVVALKILLPHVGTDEAARARFLREVSVSATIGHDGIVEVIDAGYDEDEGSLFVAMEMLVGETLAERLTHTSTVNEQLDLFERMLEPLAAAHAKGIVHRDLKPENAFLHKRRDGSEILKLLDFGIARDLDASKESVTSTNVAMGTPRYMAPEQAMSAKSVSFPADVWAMGVMMYEALTGAPPFTGETPHAIIVYTCTRPHVPLAEMAPSAPPAVVAVVERCLEKKPEDRPADAATLLAQLREARKEGGANVAAVGRAAPSDLATLPPRSLPATARMATPTPSSPAIANAAAPTTAPASSRMPLFGGAFVLLLLVGAVVVWALSSGSAPAPVAAPPPAPPPTSVSPPAAPPSSAAAADDSDDDSDESDADDDSDESDDTDDDSDESDDSDDDSDESDDGTTPAATTTTQ